MPGCEPKGDAASHNEGDTTESAAGHVEAREWHLGAGNRAQLTQEGGKKTCPNTPLHPRSVKKERLAQSPEE